MERLLKWLDDLDDLTDVFRVQAPSVIITALLVVAFVAGLGALLLLGPPDLLAAPCRGDPSNDRERQAPAR